MNNLNNPQKFKSFLTHELSSNYQKIIDNYEQIIEKSNLSPIAKIVYGDIKRRKSYIKRLKVDLKKFKKCSLTIEKA